MAKPTKRRRIMIDKKVAERIEAAKAKKEALLDENAETPVADDGIDHSRWPPEARKLAILLCDMQYSSMTQKERGETCGYSLRSVQRYENDPEFRKYVNQVAQKMYDDELYPIFVAAMKNGLKSGNSKYVELYMKSRGMLKEVRQTVADVSIKDERKGDADELDAEIEALEADGEELH